MATTAVITVVAIGLQVWAGVFFLKEKQRIDAGADLSWLDRRVSPKSAIVLAAVAYAIGLAITISTLLTS